MPVRHGAFHRLFTYQELNLPEIVSRRQAIALGLKHYFTGEPCKRGHVCERKTDCGGCVECKRLQVAANKERYAANTRAWKSLNRDRVAAQARVRRAANPEIKRARDRAFRFANRERMNAAQRARRAANPERTRAHYSLRRARKRNAPGTYTAADIAWLREAQKGKCFYCCRKLGKDYHVDHFIPLAKGGTNDRSNLRLAHPQCNLSKGAKLPEEFLGVLII